MISQVRSSGVKQASGCEIQYYFPNQITFSTVSTHMTRNVLWRVVTTSMRRLANSVGGSRHLCAGPDCNPAIHSPSWCPTQRSGLSCCWALWRLDLLSLPLTQTSHLVSILSRYSSLTFGVEVKWVGFVLERIHTPLFLGSSGLHYAIPRYFLHFSRTDNLHYKTGVSRGSAWWKYYETRELYCWVEGNLQFRSGL
jgi:hypothetical protein